MRPSWFVFAGVVWTILFALMSFYWAAGGMIGVKTLGGEIYQRALNRDPEFIPVVWATGIIKLGGAILLISLLRKSVSAKFRKWGSLICIAAGIFMILYGLLNFITISLAGINVLDFDLEAYAITWRLIFWEPFWMLGGILYVIAGRNTYRTSK